MRKDSPITKFFLVEILFGISLEFNLANSGLSLENRKIFLFLPIINSFDLIFSKYVIFHVMYFLAL